MEDELINIDIYESDNVEEIYDSRITEKINECVTIRYVKNNPQDIDIDYKNLLNIKEDKFDKQFEKIKSLNIKRRKVNGNKFFLFLKDFKVILSYMGEEEFKQLLSLRVMFENYHTLNKTEINSKLDTAILTFVPFINEFINHVDPIAYTPKCKSMEDKSLQELYFSEEHLKYLIKIIVLSKITLIFTDCAGKQFSSEAKKLTSKKIWNTVFVDGDEKINIQNKMHKLVNSRFISTIYNEKRFWAAAQFANISITSQSNALYNDLKTDSILMLVFDKNPLSFLDVFLKNTIFFLTKRKFQLEFILNNYDSQTNVMNSVISTEFKFTPLEDMLMNKSVDVFINKNVNKMLVDNDIKYEFTNSFKKNILHFWIVIPYMSKLLGVSPMFLTSIHKDKFIMLTIYVYFKLINLKCFIMAELIKSNMNEIITGVYNEEVKNMSLLLSRYLRSDDLNSFIENKEINGNVTELIKLVINPLICMSMNQFVDFNGNKIEINMSELINEYTTFLNHYISL